MILVPASLLLGQLGLWYQSRPVQVGQEQVVTLTLSEKAAAAWPDVRLQPTDAIEVTVDDLPELRSRFQQQRFLAVPMWRAGVMLVIAAHFIEGDRALPVVVENDGPEEPEPLPGVQCAIALQKAFERPSRKREALRVRVGLHTGRAISEDGDYFGENVAFAARVAQQAVGGEVLVSAAVKERTEDESSFSFSAPRTIELKGIEGVHEIYRVAEGNRS